MISRRATWVLGIALGMTAGALLTAVLLKTTERGLRRHLVSDSLGVWVTEVEAPGGALDKGCRLLVRTKKMRLTANAPQGVPTFKSPAESSAFQGGRSAAVVSEADQEVWNTNDPVTRLTVACESPYMSRPAGRPSEDDEGTLLFLVVEVASRTVSGKSGRSCVLPGTGVQRIPGPTQAVGQRNVSLVQCASFDANDPQVYWIHDFIAEAR